MGSNPARRLILIDWDAREAPARVQRLERDGFEVECHSDPAGPAWRTIPERPPDGILIDLGRRPALGRDLAIWLRQRRSTRHVPLVFIEGDPEQTERVRQRLPDAVFTSRRGVRGAVRRALASPPETPVVPDPMSGHSGTPLPTKLGIKADTVLALLGAPETMDRTLGELPAGVRILRQARGVARVVVLFVRSHAELRRRFDTAVRTMQEGGRLWIAWPKRASGIVTDLDQRVVRAYSMERGLVDYKIAAIDAVWSGLCFARRAARDGRPGYSKRSRK